MSDTTEDNIIPNTDEIAKFPQAPEPPVLAENNLDGVPEDQHAILSGADVDPNGEGEVKVK